MKVKDVNHGSMVNHGQPWVNYALTCFNHGEDHAFNHGWSYQGQPWLTMVNYALTMVKTMLAMLGQTVVNHG